MSYTGASLTDEQLAQGAYLRHVEELDWEPIAKAIGCSPTTLRAARHTERWEEACKPYEVAKADLRRISYTQLEKLIRAGKFDAIIQGIDRSEGSVKQEHVIEHKGEALGKLTKDLDSLAARLGAGEEIGDADG